MYELSRSPWRHLTATTRAFVALCLATFVASCSTDEARLPPLLPVTDTALIRGRELVEGVAACGFCHSLDGKPGSALAGGRVLIDRYGEVAGPNITLSSTGIGGWAEADALKLFRAKMTPSGSAVSEQFHGGFEWLSDADVSAIVGYLRTLPPVQHAVEHRKIDFVERNSTGFFAARREVRGYVPEIPSRFQGPFGQYLADHVARCGSCHTTPESLLAGEQYWGGGREVVLGGVGKVAPNITTSKASGIGGWKEAELTQYLTSGRKPDRGRVDPQFCPVGFYAQSRPEDIAALVAYVRSVPALD
jgi:mono/diheme cytochrome c family protein